MQLCCTCKKIHLERRNGTWIFDFYDSAFNLVRSGSCPTSDSPGEWTEDFNGGAFKGRSDPRLCKRGLHPLPEAITRTEKLRCFTHKKSAIRFTKYATANKKTGPFTFTPVCYAFDAKTIRRSKDFRNSFHSFSRKKSGGFHEL